MVITVFTQTQLLACVSFVLVVVNFVFDRSVWLFGSVTDWSELFINPIVSARRLSRRILPFIRRIISYIGAYHKLHPGENRGINSILMVKAQAKVPSLVWPIRVLPTIVSAGRHPHEDRHFQPVYCNHHAHSLHLYEYPCTMRLDRRQIEIQPGDVTISPATKLTSYDLPAEGHHLVIHFAVDGFNDPADKTVNLPLHLRPNRDRATQKLLTVIRWHSLASHKPINEAAASAAFQEFVLWLVLSPRVIIGQRTGSISDQAVENAAAFIERQIDQPLSIPLLSEKVKLSQNYLARHFRQRFGVSMQRYLINRRIDFAQQLLASTTLPVGQIARRVGMPNPQHFNKQFRRLVGISPSRARASGRDPSEGV